MSEINSEIVYNTERRQIDIEDLCKRPCTYKFEVLKKMDDILDNPHYEYENDDWCELVRACQLSPQNTCVIAVKKVLYNLDV